MIKKFTKFIVEKVQSDWFDKNPNFYLSKNVKDINKYKDQEKESEEKNRNLISKLKKISVGDIKFQYINGKYSDEYEIISPDFLNKQYFKHRNEIYTLSVYEQQFDDYYKLYLAFINMINIKNYGDSIEFENVSKNIINPLFKELSEYYSLYYKKDYDNLLFLTKDKNEYKEKINLIKYDYKDAKIIYYNNKVKGKELTDFDLIEITKIKNQLKNITIDDIYFDGNIDKYDRKVFNVRFKDKDLDKKVKKYNLVDFELFTQEKDPRKVYFGHLKNRYHARGLASEVKGIGLGYKIYKAFLKFNGYMVSDSQTTIGARKIYYNMLKDDDIYHVIDKNAGESTYSSDSDKIMLIWKTFPKIKQLLRIVRTHELRNGRKYEYDKVLLNDLKNIKE